MAYAAASRLSILVGALWELVRHISPFVDLAALNHGVLSEDFLIDLDKACRRPPRRGSRRQPLFRGQPGLLIIQADLRVSVAPCLSPSTCSCPKRRCRALQCCLLQQCRCRHHDYNELLLGEPSVVKLPNCLAASFTERRLTALLLTPCPSTTWSMCLRNLL